MFGRWVQFKGSSIVGNKVIRQKMCHLLNKVHYSTSIITGEPVPDAGREADAGEQDGADDDAGLQLVQEPAAEGQDALLGVGGRRRGEGRVRMIKI